MFTLKEALDEICTGIENGAKIQIEKFMLDEGENRIVKGTKLLGETCVYSVNKDNAGNVTAIFMLQPDAVRFLPLIDIQMFIRNPEGADTILNIIHALKEGDSEKLKTLLEAAKILPRFNLPPFLAKIFENKTDKETT